jgi:hypothetical protein
MLFLAPIPAFAGRQAEGVSLWLAKIDNEWKKQKVSIICPFFSEQLALQILQQ